MVDRSLALAATLRVVVAEPDRHLRSMLSWLVDDDPRLLLVGAHRSGAEAAAAEPFDLALLDLATSGLGEGVLPALRQRAPAPTIVVVSPADVPYLRHAAAFEGAAGFLVRPGDLERLGDRLVSIHSRLPPPAR